MLIPKRGDMYVADLGQGIGSEQANERPVVIIQNNKGNHYADTTIIVPIYLSFADVDHHSCREHEPR